MNFNLQEAIEILERTPVTLEHFLTGLSEGWLTCNEGEGTWNVSEVIGHLIEAEKYNWMPRLETMLQEGKDNRLPPFDRFSHLRDTSERSIRQKCHELKTIRAQNVSKLTNLVDPESHLERTGLHPEFGTVKLRELLSAWVAHDLTHIAQIVRVMAGRYRADVGPWVAYLGVLQVDRTASNNIKRHEKGCE